MSCRSATTCSIRETFPSLAFRGCRCSFNPTRISRKQTQCSSRTSRRRTEQKGSTLLASYTYPLQFIWGRKKLESLDGIKGMKLRVAQPEQGEFVRRFGGTSITMSAPEVPSALDRGVVDGIFTAGVGAVLWKDLLKYGYVLIINVNNSYFIANTEAYNKLSPDLQGKLRKVAQDIGALGPGDDADGRSGIGSSPHRCGIHPHQGDTGGEHARG